MGYDLHITRREHWADDETGEPITREQWQAYVDADPTMRWSDPSDDGMAFWFKRAEHREREDLPWLWWDMGEVISKNPDVELRRKMWTVAQSLGANLQGDDGELYGEDGERLAAPEDADGKGEMSGGAKPWWKFW